MTSGKAKDVSGTEATFYVKTISIDHLTVYQEELEKYLKNLKS